MFTPRAQTRKVYNVGKRHATLRPIWLSFHFVYFCRRTGAFVGWASNRVQLRAVPQSSLSNLGIRSACSIDLWRSRDGGTGVPIYDFEKLEPGVQRNKLMAFSQLTHGENLSPFAAWLQTDRRISHGRTVER